MTDLSNLTYFIETFGCQMNENDSERIAGVLNAAGAHRAASAADSGLVIVNTCAVRGKSEEKLYSYLGRLRARKKKRGLVIAVAGCVAQLHRGALSSGRPFVDIVIGPDNYHRLPELLAVCDSCADQVVRDDRVDQVGRASCADQVVRDDRVADPAAALVLTAWSRGWNEEERRLMARESPVSAFVTIMEGCNNFCAYCIVPFTRGREKFRPLPAVLADVEALARGGYREIQFLGQNVNAYRDPETGAGFSDLLDRSSAVPGPGWIRFITSHPRSFGPDIIAAMARCRTVCRQLHLPLQSGSSTVLERMKRGYSRVEYLDKIRRLREAMPEIHLSTDIIVGFPEETEEEFKETMSALAEIRFSNIFSFRYSPRPGTSAARRTDDIPLEVKRRRLTEVQALQKSIQTEIHRAFVGRTIRVLGTGRSRKDAAVFSGRSEGYQVVNFSAADDAVGRFVQVRVTSAGPYSLRGEAAAFEPLPAPLG
jgi:tRNA-2-methylthio-N6-dimethylallyladenosine synthase